MMAGEHPPGGGAPRGESFLAGRSRTDQLQVIGSDTLSLQGDVHHLVTFLNQCLKEEGLIFGLTRVSDGRFRLTVYRA